MRSLFITCAILCLLFQSTDIVQAQEKDSIEKVSHTKKAFKQGMKFISTHPEDTIINEESADPYIAYAGKIIRNIIIDRIGFDKSTYDSAKKMAVTVTKSANFLHVFAIS